MLSVNARRPLAIPEVLTLILLELDNVQDLVSVACASRRFTDSCMRKIWEAPDFQPAGAPLTSMLATFPEHVRDELSNSHDLNMRVDLKDFARFDYYAKFVRSLTLWHQDREGYLAEVLTASRPGVLLFPELSSLHIGAGGNELRIAPAYLAPTLKSVRLNHWQLQHHRDVSGTDPVKIALMTVCNMDNLETLDLMDTVYGPFESDPEIVNGLVKLASQLYEIKSYSFLTLEPVFSVLSRNNRLHTLSLNLEHDDSEHISLQRVITAIRHEFTVLRSLSLACALDQAVRVVRECGRSFEELDLRLNAAITAVHLHELTTNIFTETPTLRCFRVFCSGEIELTAGPPLRMSEAIQPLLECHDIREIHVSMVFEGQQVMTDEEMRDFCVAWPKLTNCVFDADPDGNRPAPDEEEPTDYGLSLATIAFAAQHCRLLTEFALPYVNTTVLPDISRIPTSDAPMSLHISGSHVHNRDELLSFVISLWPDAEVSVGSCSHFPAKRLQK